MFKALVYSIAFLAWVDTPHPISILVHSCAHQAEFESQPPLYPVNIIVQDITRANDLKFVRNNTCQLILRKAFQSANFEWQVIPRTHICRFKDWKVFSKLDVIGLFFNSNLHNTFIVDILCRGLTSVFKKHSNMYVLISPDWRYLNVGKSQICSKFSIGYFFRKRQSFAGNIESVSGRFGGAPSFNQSPSYEKQTKTTNAKANKSGISHVPLSRQVTTRSGPFFYLFLGVFLCGIFGGIYFRWKWDEPICGLIAFISAWGVMVLFAGAI